jgi:hypothetical protein
LARRSRSTARSTSGSSSTVRITGLGNRTLLAYFLWIAEKRKVIQQRSNRSRERQRPNLARDWTGSLSATSRRGFVACAFPPSHKSLNICCPIFQSFENSELLHLPNQRDKLFRPTANSAVATGGVATLVCATADRRAVLGESQISKKFSNYFFSYLINSLPGFFACPTATHSSFYRGSRANFKSLPIKTVRRIQTFKRPGPQSWPFCFFRSHSNGQITHHAVAHLWIGSNR